MPRPAHQFMRRARLAGWMLLLTCLSAGRTRAREVEIEYPIAPFRILERGGETGFRYDYLTETDSSDGGDEASYSNQSFQEYIEYRIRGYVYHPRFLDFRGRVELGLLQQIITRDGTNDDDGTIRENELLHGYDIYLDFFKEHPYSLQLFASRDREPVLELFTDLEMIETERYGAVANIKRGPFPTDISYTETKTREWGADSFSDSTNRTFETVIHNYYEQWMYSELRYRHMEYQQNFNADTGYFDVRRRTELNSDDLQFLNTIYLNKERTSTLGTTLRGFQQSGTQEFENYFWQERLHLRHSPNFSTYYLGSMLENKYRNSTVSTVRGEAGLDHRLFRSLQSHLDAHWRHTEYERAEEDVYGVTGRLNYRKQTPWGQLGAGYGRTLDQVDRTVGDSSRTIIDERVTLSANRVEYLDNVDLEINSIEVTDDQGQDQYDEGFDYEIRKSGNRVGLRLLSGGRIQDGETVLVDYELKRNNDLSYLSDLQTANVAYDVERYLKGLSVYYRWQDLAARNFSGPSDRSVLTYNDQVVGMTYAFPWFTWLEEYEMYRSQYSSYDQLRSELESYRQIGQRLRLGWHAGITTTDYMDDGPTDHAESVYTGLTLDGKIRSQSHWQLEAGTRHETGLVDEDVLGLSGKLVMNIRRLKIETGARLEQRERENTERDRAIMYFQISREFGRTSRRQ